MDRAPARTVYVYCGKETESVEAAASAAAKKRRMKQAASASAGGMEVDGEGRAKVPLWMRIGRGRAVDAPQRGSKGYAQVALLRLERDLVVFESAPAPANSSAPAL
ncbi:hypothetical protein BCR44DRAFT_1440148 [Catenaria anguillulae PL171]|uniref:Uncharacterized protein n=1 Tax=Catenaria anguillulae PL171 TaxID=765915 RepID=A0A1Y2HCW5_9FUNG|nr:hypothetical protein BCR44DRAFT_1440148 [Catenaria anguillulae PL171]